MRIPWRMCPLMTAQMTLWSIFSLSVRLGTDTPGRTAFLRPVSQSSWPATDWTATCDGIAACMVFSVGGPFSWPSLTVGMGMRLDTLSHCGTLGLVLSQVFEGVTTSAPIGPLMECLPPVVRGADVRFSRWDHEEQVIRTHRRGNVRMPSSGMLVGRKPSCCCRKSWVPKEIIPPRQAWGTTLGWLSSPKVAGTFTPGTPR
mmetsp:Transcript_128462/g.287235  ORF Transcript_128462/g.287235 Transcript_128462/m.287235 type:complete len:201 (-) Transcript_128462:523-1125(-)